MRKTDEYGTTTKTGTTPGGRPYVSKKNKLGDKQTTVKGKKVISIKASNDSVKAKYALSNQPRKSEGSFMSGAKMVKKGHTKKAK